MYRTANLVIAGHGADALIEAPKEQAEIVRQQIAYLEAILSPKGAQRPADVIGSRSANRHAVLTAKLGKLGVVVLVGLTERSIEGPTCWAVIGRRFGLL
jgi:hypothetical protein